MRRPDAGQKAALAPRKRGRPAKAVAAKPIRDVAAEPVKVCPFEEKLGSRCGAPISRKDPFCIRHMPLDKTVGEMVEGTALGEEAAARLREELNVDEARNEEIEEKAALIATQMASEIRDRLAKEQREADREAMEGARRLAEEMNLVKTPREPERPKRPERERSADEEAHRLALAMVMKERREQTRRAESRERRGSLKMSATDRAAMSLSVHFPEMPDPTAMIDSRGKSLVPPGYTGRWIRKSDMGGKPSARRVNEFKIKLNAVPVLDENGDELEGDFGKAMMYTNERRAAWILHKSPSGAYDAAAQGLEMAHEAAEQLNREVDRNVVQVVAREEHGCRMP